MPPPLQIERLTLAALDPRDLAVRGDVAAVREHLAGERPLIRAAGFQHFLDVGANHGLVAMLAAQQGLKVLCVEADPRLFPAIERHFADNGLACVAVVNAIAGASADERTSFSLNPGGTLDNRVEMPQWEHVPVRTIALAGLVAEHGFDTAPMFIKIDTQGFEQHVLAGLWPYLEARRDWMIKMEFAPQWLESQGTDPLELLQWLLARFEVAECPERIVWGTPDLDALFPWPLVAERASAFLAAVRDLDFGGRGWVDLLVRPRGA